jgi:hypothetical protein
MSRRPFGWDLPPGVTHRMIDEAAGAVTVECAVCGRPCVEDDDGWYCRRCDARSETDVEVE